MKNFFKVFEEIWVAVAFAEAGEYDLLHDRKMQPRYHEAVRVQAS
jgi:hypothetical protein